MAEEKKKTTKAAPKKAVTAKAAATKAADKPAEKKAAAKKAAPKKTAAKKDAPKKDAEKKPAAKKATVAKESTAKKTTKPAAAKATKSEAKVEKKVEAPKVEAKVETKEEKVKVEVAPEVKEEAPKVEAPKVEAKKEPKATPAPSGDDSEGTMGSTDIRMEDLYKTKVIDALMKEFNYTSVMQVPKITKVVVNMGVGEAVTNNKAIDGAVKDLTAITGQKPLVTKAKKSIATFKLREGMPIGCMTTMRGDRMYEFFDRLINFSMPRIRDFRGLSDKSFDGRGNYTFGIKEQLIYPEIEYDKIDKIRGMNITIATSARTDEEGKALLRFMGMPFRS